MMFSEHHNYKPICSMNLWIDLAVNGFSERVELLTEYHLLTLETKFARIHIKMSGILMRQHLC